MGDESQETAPDSNITNLSRSYRLSPIELGVLEKGLTFIPTPQKLDRLELRRDLYVYHRRLKLLDHFDYETDFSREPFTDPSTWDPKLESASPPIQLLVRKDLNVFGRFKPRPPNKSNLTMEELKAIKDLSSNSNIIIKPADKGSQIVLMDKAQYLLEANRQLSNDQHYSLLPHSIQPETQDRIREMVRELCETNFITKRQMFYLMGPDVPRPRQFYLLPKIHKAPDKWTVPSRVPCGRPIVSDCGSESYRVAEYIDFHINPLSQRHNSYIKDTYDFVNKIKGLIVPRGSFLFSIDINSLYTNIDTALGLQAVQNAFDKFPDPERPDRGIIRLLELSLTRNDFVFNDKNYLQIHGTAMGKKFAPAYANLYMCFWEETAFIKCRHLPLVYYRYLDDIFGIWEHSSGEFQDFLGILNTHHPAISITHNIQWEKLEFLDTQVFFRKQEGETLLLGETTSLATKVFFKETDRHALLHKTSFHPKHTYRGLVKSQLIRFNRICTYPEDVEEATGTLFRALGPRGYAKRFLREIKAEVKRTFQREGGYKKTIDNRNIIPLVVTYSQSFRVPTSRLKFHFQQAQQSVGELENFRVISAYRRNKNLKDMLVHSSFSTKKQPPKNEKHCLKIKYLNNIFSKRGMPIWQEMGLSTSNVVYGIRCNLCQKIYIGETQNSVGVRLKQHLYHMVKMDRLTSLYTHFQEHSFENVSIFGLETNQSWSKTQRQKRERHWIAALNTIDPLGLNEKF